METSTLSAHDGRNIPLCYWPAFGSARGIVLIARDLSEYAARYERFALQRAAAEFEVVAPSRALAALIFGSFNLGFLPTRTPVDWFSRAPAEVNHYLADTDLLQWLNRVVTRTLQ